MRVLRFFLVIFALGACGKNTTSPERWGDKSFHIKTKYFQHCTWRETENYFQWPDYQVRRTDIYDCELPDPCEVYVDNREPSKMDYYCGD